MFETVLAGAAATWGVLMALSPALQIHKMIRYRSSRDVSIGYFCVLLVGFVLWVAYGITIDNYVLAVPNAVAFSVCVATIVVALWYRRSAP